MRFIETFCIFCILYSVFQSNIANYYLIDKRFPNIFVFFVNAPVIMNYRYTSYYKQLRASAVFITDRLSNYYRHRLQRRYRDDV